MIQPLFESLPDSARLWINAADRELTQNEQEQILSALRAFIGQWSSHGRKVEGEATIVNDRFVVVAAHIPGGDVSGCGIDASVHALSGLAQAIGFDWASALDVFYDADGRVEQTDRGGFARLASRGEVALETSVYDTSLATLAQFRQGEFCRPAKQSWHGRIFSFASTTA